MVVESLSRAAMFSFSLIMMAVFIGKSIPFAAKVGLVACIFIYITFQSIGLSGSGGLSLIEKFEVLNKASERLNLLENNDPETYSERGYQRLYEFPEYLLFGAGEGAHWRFMDVIYSGREIHSGLATILFSYGVFGFFVFGTFIFTIFQRAPVLFLLTLGAVMAYGLTHQHVRFTGFWIYIGIVYSVTRYILPSEQKETHANPS